MTRKQKAAAIAAAGLIAGAVVFLSLPDAPLPPRSVIVSWTASPSPEVDYYELWASTNLSSWYAKTNISLCLVKLPADLPCEFYRVRAHSTNGMVSVWSTR